MEAQVQLRRKCRNGGVTIMIDAIKIKSRGKGGRRALNYEKERKQRNTERTPSMSEGMEMVLISVRARAAFADGVDAGAFVPVPGLVAVDEAGDVAADVVNLDEDNDAVEVVATNEVMGGRDVCRVPTVIVDNCVSEDAAGTGMVVVREGTGEAKEPDILSRLMLGGRLDGQGKGQGRRLT
jgi:hypothetical protein